VFTRAPIPRPCVTLVTRFISGEELFSPSPNPEAEGQPLFGCPRLLFQHIGTYFPYLDAVSSICNTRTRSNRGAFEYVANYIRRTDLVLFAMWVSFSVNARVTSTRRNTQRCRWVTCSWKCRNVSSSKDLIGWIALFMFTLRQVCKINALLGSRFR